MKRVKCFKNDHGVCSLCDQTSSFVESCVDFIMNKFRIIKQSSTFQKFLDFHDVLSYLYLNSLKLQKLGTVT